MNRLLAFCIKVGIFGALVFFLVSSNPPAAKHLAAIAAKEAILREQDVIGKSNKLMYGEADFQTEEGTRVYKSFFIFSKIIDPDGEMASFGFCSKVYVTKSEL